MVCLILGDFGVVLILECFDWDDVGFYVMEMFILGDYSSLCIVKLIDFDYGGVIMLMELVCLVDVVVKEGFK